MAGVKRSRLESYTSYTFTRDYQAAMTWSHVQTGNIPEEGTIRVEVAGAQKRTRCCVLKGSPEDTRCLRVTDSWRLAGLTPTTSWWNQSWRLMSSGHISF